MFKPGNPNAYFQYPYSHGSQVPAQQAIQNNVKQLSCAAMYNNPPPMINTSGHHQSQHHQHNTMPNQLAYSNSTSSKSQHGQKKAYQQQGYTAKHLVNNQKENSNPDNNKDNANYKRTNNVSLRKLITLEQKIQIRLY